MVVFVCSQNWRRRIELSIWLEADLAGMIAGSINNLQIKKGRKLKQDSKNSPLHRWIERCRPHEWREIECEREAINTCTAI